MTADEQRARLVSLATALTAGVHWGQVLRQEKTPAAGAEVLFGRGSLSSDRVRELHENFKVLAKIDPAKITAWTAGRDDAELSALIAKLNAEKLPTSEKLPVNLLNAYMRRRLTGPEEFFVRAIANLGQLCMEVNHDGTWLQDLFRIYIALGISQTSLPADEDGQIAAGEELSKLSGPAPFDTDPAAYRVMIKKIVNWVEKNSGHRDRYVVARDMLKEPFLQPLLPKLKALPPRRVAFLGHSMMMSLHWSTSGSWCDIAAEVMKLINPGFDYRDFQSGGLTPTRGVKEHLANVLAYQPTETYMLIFVARPEDQAALEHICSELKRIGSAINLVNDVRPWNEIKPEVATFTESLMKKFSGRLIDFHGRGKGVPGSEQWPSLDQIHMITEGHLFYARETLKMWAAG